MTAVKRQLFKGQAVMVFQDPLTEMHQEGAAVLLSRQRVDDLRQRPRCETWLVRFMSDKSTAYREILIEA
jgi:hypothetical protein